jgi:recombination protein RecA
MYNEGISKMGDVLDLGTELEIITKRGAFFSYGDIRLGQGRENAKDFLRQNLDIAGEIEAAVRQRAAGSDVLLRTASGGGGGGDDDGGYGDDE